MKPKDVGVMRQQMDEAIDAAISTKVTPEFHRISSDIASMQSDVTALKSDVKNVKSGQDNANAKLDEILERLNPPKP